MEEVDEVESPAATSVASEIYGTASPAAEPVEAANINNAVTEGLSILQKGIFLLIITACIVVYIRMNKVKEEDVQKYEKIVA